MKSTIIIENKFTGYRAEVLPRKGNTPVVATLRRHIRRSKAKGCQSATTLTLVAEEGGTYRVDIHDGAIRYLETLT